MYPQPHQHRYGYYQDCGHRVKECHPGIPFWQRTMNPVVRGKCVKCTDRADRKMRESLGVAVG